MLVNLGINEDDVTKKERHSNDLQDLQVEDFNCQLVGMSKEHNY